MTERPTPEQIEDIRKAVAVAFDLSHEQPSDVLAEWVVSLLAEVDALREEMRNLDVVEEHNAELRKNALPSNCTRCNGKGAEPPCCPESGPCERCGGWTSHKRLVAGAEAAAIARAVAAERERDEQRQRAEEAEYGCEVLSVGDPYERLRDVREAGKTALRERDEARAKLVAAEQRAETAELALEELRRRAWLHLEYAGGYTDHVSRDVLRTALRDEPTDLAEALRRELRAEGMEEVAVMLERVGEGRSSRATKAMAAAMRGGAK